jgi:hypothetical protein
MQILIKPNMAVPEIPDFIEIVDGSCLRDVLSIITPHMVDRVTGELKDDPDIWDVKHNSVSIHSLREGLDTEMREGDIIELELILLAGG